MVNILVALIIVLVVPLVVGLVAYSNEVLVVDLVLATVVLHVVRLN